MQVLEPPVRSVRVAIALKDRFKMIMNGPTSGDPAAMSVRIGEAEQIYPEIWNHLDEARKGFAAKGVDTSAFDEIRLSEFGKQGILDMRLEGNGDYQVRVVRYNVEGCWRAEAAAGALMRANPEVDWAGIAAAEDAEIVAAGDISSKAWIPVLAITIIILVALFIFLRK